MFSVNHCFLRGWLLILLSHKKVLVPPTQVKLILACIPCVCVLSQHPSSPWAQVYNYNRDSQSLEENDDSESFSIHNNWEKKRGEEYDNGREEEKEEQPRPPPPAPIPQPSGRAHPRRLKQHWGTYPVRRGGWLPADAAKGAQEGVFVPPSTLQEPSLWSTAMEQAALERRMKEVGPK